MSTPDAPSSPSSSPALRTARLGSVSHRQRLLSISALSVDEEIRRSEGGGFAVPMDGAPSPAGAGAVRRVKADDFESLPLHLRRRGSLPRTQPDPSLRPPPSPSSMARTLSSSPVRGSFDLHGGQPPSPSASSATLTSFPSSFGRPTRGPSSPLSTPTSEYPPDGVDPRAASPSLFVPPPHKPPATPVFTFPLPIPSPSMPLPEPPAPHAAAPSDDQAAGARARLPTLHVSTASDSSIGPPPELPLPTVPRPLPRGPSGFRGLGRRPSMSGTPSPTREVFWGGQGGSARRGSAAVTPGGSVISDDGQTVITPGGSMRLAKGPPSPLADFTLKEGKMLNVRARVATPKGDRPAFIEMPSSCPPFHSPIPSPLLSPTSLPSSHPRGDPFQQRQLPVTAPPTHVANAPADVTGSPLDASFRSSSFSVASASSDLSTSSSMTASTAALNTPSNTDAFHPHQPPARTHAPVVSQPPELLTVESALNTPVVPHITETAGSDPETGTVPPLPDVLRSRKSSTSSAGRGSDRSDRRRRPSGQGALKLDLTDDERIARVQSKISVLQQADADDYSDDLLSAYPSVGRRPSEASFSRTSSSTPSLVADLRKGSTASYRSFSSTRSEPFAYDDGWSGSDDSDDESIPLPRPRHSFSRSSSGAIPPVPAFVRRPSAQDLISSFPAPPDEPQTLETVPNRSSSLPVPLPSPNSSLRSNASVATARPLSQPDSRSSFFARPVSTASGYFPAPGEKPARPSSIFSLLDDGCLVSEKGRVLPRPKRDNVGMWGDVEIAYESAGGANLSRAASKGSQTAGAGPSTRRWEEAAERLPERKKLLGRRESAASSAGSGASSDKGSASSAKPATTMPPSAMRKSLSTAPSPSSPTSAVPAAQAPRSIPVRKSSSNQLRPSGSSSPTAGSPSPSRLPPPALKKTYSGQIPQQRSPMASSPLAGSRRPIELPTIEPLRITKAGAVDQPALAAPSPTTKNKPLPVAPAPAASTSSGIPTPRPSGLPTRTPPKSHSPTATPTTRSPEKSPAASTSAALPLAAVDDGAAVDPSKSPKPAFGPAAGRRMSKRPSVSAASRSKPATSPHFYAAPPLPPLPMLPPALASQRQ